MRSLEYNCIRLSFLFLLNFFFSSPSFAAASDAVHLIQLDNDTVNPVTAEYITQGIDRAEKEKAQCLIILLDTPGGLLESTRTIVKKILASTVPVVVYIAPSGSRAGSAGVFITYASHVAAMAPSTNIGAAHPVGIGGRREKERDFWDGFKELTKDQEAKKQEAERQEKKTREVKPADKGKNAETKADQKESAEYETDEDVMGGKILQDTVAFIKAMAKKRNRNVEWAINSVTKSSSITETEARALGVVEIIARDETDLLNQLDGRTVTTGENPLILKTKGAAVERFPMDARQKFLNILANPNIAYLLLILGFYGLLYEVTHPGVGAPGVIGAIFLILAFFSMQTLPTNYAGLALVILSLVLFVAEAFYPGWGLLAVGGIVCMILGSLLLFDSSASMMQVSRSLILAVVTPTAGLTIFLVRAVLRSRKRKILGGQEGLIGEKGEVAHMIAAHGEGKVFVHGELWNATADESIKKGEKIVVHRVEGMVLKVKKHST